MLREDRKFVKTFNIYFSNILKTVDIKKNESICEIIFRPEEILHCMQKKKYTKHTSILKIRNLLQNQKSSVSTQGNFKS